MDIKEQFNLIAEEYDKNRKRFIPCFEDYYIGATDFIASNIAAPKCILDLGAGTGLLSYYWFKHFPESEYLLVDIADDMLNIARKRFLGIDNVSFAATDFTNRLPCESIDVVISALAIHHLENAQKQRLFSQIFDKLPEGGLFVNYDQFCAGDKQLNEWYDTYWEKHLAESGLTDNDISLWQERRKLDRECSVEQETEMLLNCGFKTVKCVYSNQKFSVIAAIK